MQKSDRSILFVRLGLFFVHSLGISFTLHALIESFQPFVARAIVFGVAIVINIILGGVSIISSLRETNSHLLSIPARITIAALDASLAIAFLVLHIVNVQKAKEDNQFEVYDTVTLMYGAFFALIASVIHFGLSTAQAHVLLKSWYAGSATCPVCKHSSSRSPGAPAQDRSSANTPTHANEAGMSEGDRLITTADNE